jgi:hypothetical protein
MFGPYTRDIDEDDEEGSWEDNETDALGNCFSDCDSGL